MEGALLTVGGPGYGVDLCPRKARSVPPCALSAWLCKFAGRAQTLAPTCDQGPSLWLPSLKHEDARGFTQSDRREVP